MRKILLEVPAKLMQDFTEKLTYLELENSIIGKNEEDEIEVEVYYDKSESGKVDELEEYLEEIKEQYYQELEEEEEEEEEQDED
jgi:hypothetical protein